MQMSKCQPKMLKRWRDALRARNGCGVNDGADSPLGENEAQGAADCRKQDTFREELNHEAPPTGAQRGTDAEFLSPGYATRERQVGHISAGNK